MSRAAMPQFWERLVRDYTWIARGLVLGAAIAILIGVTGAISWPTAGGLAGFAAVVFIFTLYVRRRFQRALERLRASDRS